MKNQVFLVFDSLRWDIFKKAKVPFLKSLGEWKKAYTPGTYTFPAHMSFFAGKLPQTFDKTIYYDTVVTRTGKKRNRQLWRLTNPEAPKDAVILLEGENIIDGFNKLDYTTIGTGGVNWFNPKLPPGKYLTSHFEHYRFFDGPNYAYHESAESQIDWTLSCIKKTKKSFFLFINFGETHSIFKYKNCPWHEEKYGAYGNAKKCKLRQKLCLEYLNKKIEGLFKELNNFDFVICSDHGEALGENGCWGHGFFHPKIMEVPLLIKTSGNDENI